MSGKTLESEYKRNAVNAECIQSQCAVPVINQ